MRSGMVLSDRLVAAGFIRPAVLFRGLQLSRPALRRSPVGLLMAFSGLLVEPLAWLQSLLLRRRLRRLVLPPDPLVVIGHWRSGTTFLHQLLAADPAWATARNSLTVAPQVAVLLKPLLRPLLRLVMTTVRPIDAVPWSENDPQEDELGIARLCMDTNMAGMAFPRAYPVHFRRSVLETTAGFERQWLHFARLTWLHDGRGRSGLLIKNGAHSARVGLILRHFPRARFVLLRREPSDSIRSLLEAFEASRAVIPPGQLLELDYEDLVATPLAAVQRIYDHFDCPGWERAQTAIAARLDQARSYRADPVRLSAAAESRLQQLLASR